MKATIAGVKVEGTPQEIAEYQRVLDDQRRAGIHIKPPLGPVPAHIQEMLERPLMATGAIIPVSKSTITCGCAACMTNG